MTTGDPDDILLRRPDLLKNLAADISDTITPLLRETISSEYRNDAKLLDNIARLHDEITRLNEEEDHSSEIRLNAIEEKNTTGRQLNNALELLWQFIDAASDRPRHGNIFDRARELIPETRIQQAQSVGFGYIFEKMFGHTPKGETFDVPRTSQRFLDIVRKLKELTTDGGYQPVVTHGKNTPYTEANNIYTCDNGHSYSFHTIEAVNLKEEGVCQLCLVNELNNES